MQVQLLGPNEYEFEDLRYELSRDRGEPLSPRTLRYWLREIGIERNEAGFYEHSDLEVLRLWMSLKPQIRTIERFRAILRRKNNAA